MKRSRWLFVAFWFICPPLAMAATYTVTTTTKEENTLARAVASGGSHAGQTHAQVVEGLVHTMLERLFRDQRAKKARELDDKMDYLTPAELNTIDTQVNAALEPPIITPIPAQTNQVNDVVLIPIVATDPDNLPPVYELTGGPAGVTTGTTELGAPVIKGTITVIGTFTPTLRAYKNGWRDVVGSTTFSWTVAP